MDVNQARAAELKQIMDVIPGAKAGKMFGMPGYMVNGKLAVGLFEDDAVAKVGAARVKALSGKANVEQFVMRDRAWKEWVRVSGKLADQRAVLEEAVRYVAENSE